MASNPNVPNSTRRNEIGHLLIGNRLNGASQQESINMACSGPMIEGGIFNAISQNKVSYSDNVFAPGIPSRSYSSALSSPRINPPVYQRNNSPNFLGPIGSERKASPTPISPKNPRVRVPELYNLPSPIYQMNRVRTISCTSGMSNEDFQNSISMTPPKSPEAFAIDGNLLPNHPACIPNINLNLRKYREDNQVIPCYHDNRLKFCKDCSMMLCPSCVKAHKNHVFENYDDNNNFENKQNLMPNVDDEISKFQSLFNSLEATKIKSKRDISLAAKKQIEAICLREQHLLNAVDEGYTSVFKSTNSLYCKIYQDIETSREKENSFVFLMDKRESNKQKLILKENIDKAVGELEADKDFIKVKLNKEDEEMILKMTSSFGSVECCSKASYTVASGAALKYLLWDNNSHFYIECKDYFGNLKTTGDEDLKAIIAYSNGTSEKIPIQNFGYGVYEGTISTNQAEIHSINITLKGMEISNPIHRPIIRSKWSIDDIAIEGIQPINLGADLNMGFRRGWGIHCHKDGKFFITDKDNDCVLVYDENKLYRKFGKRGENDGEFSKPNGITIDINNRIIIADKDNHRIQVFSLLGKFLFKFGKRGRGKGEFEYPWDVATNSFGEIAVTDQGNNCLHLFDPNGNLLMHRYLNMDPKKIRFRLPPLKPSPRGVVFHGDDVIYISEFQKGYLVRYQINRKENKILFDGRIKLGLVEDFEKPQGILIAENKIIVAEAKLNRILFIDIEELVNRYCGKYETTVYLYNMLEPNYIRNFEPSNLTITPDGILYAIHATDSVIYRINTNRCRRRTRGLTMNRQNFN